MNDIPDARIQFHFHRVTAKACHAQHMFKLVRVSCPTRSFAGIQQRSTACVFSAQPHARLSNCDRTNRTSILRRGPPLYISSPSDKCFVPDQPRRLGPPASRRLKLPTRQRELLPLIHSPRLAYECFYAPAHAAVRELSSRRVRPQCTRASISERVT